MKNKYNINMLCMPHEKVIIDKHRASKTRHDRN